MGSLFQIGEDPQKLAAPSSGEVMEDLDRIASEQDREARVVAGAFRAVDVPENFSSLSVRVTGSEEIVVGPHYNYHAGLRAPYCLDRKLRRSNP